MREVRQTRLKLQRLRDNLFKTDDERCLSDLQILWDYMRSDPFVTPIVDELSAYAFDFASWSEQAVSQRQYSFPPNERDRAAMCLAILHPANFQTGAGIWQIAWALVLDKSGSSRIDAKVQAFFEVFLTPLYQYIDERLLERESMVTPSDIMLEITQVVGEETVKSFPNTVEALQTAYRDLYSASGKVIWKNIGNACRAALIAFADETYVPSMSPAGAPQPKGDDAKQKIALALRHSRTQKPGGDNYLEAVESMIKATWDMASSLLHRKDATDHDAKACVMYTYLAVWNAAALIAERVHHK
jgi:hypothetical protein